jgi:hypothetical protein
MTLPWSTWAGGAVVAPATTRPADATDGVAVELGAARITAAAALFWTASARETALSARALNALRDVAWAAAGRATVDETSVVPLALATATSA